jgi:hypothetical protein
MVGRTENQIPWPSCEIQRDFPGTPRNSRELPANSPGTPRELSGNSAGTLRAIPVKTQGKPKSGCSCSQGDRVYRHNGTPGRARRKSTATEIRQNAVETKFQMPSLTRERLLPTAANVLWTGAGWKPRRSCTEDHEKKWRATRLSACWPVNYRESFRKISDLTPDKRIPRVFCMSGRSGRSGWSVSGMLGMAGKSSENPKSTPYPSQPGRIRSMRPLWARNVPS